MWKLGLLILALASARAEEERKREGVHWGAYPTLKYATDEGVTLGAFARRFNYGESPGVSPFHDLWSVVTSFSQQGPSWAGVGYDRTHIGPLQLRSSTFFWLSDNSSERYYGLGEGASLDKAREEDGYNFYHLREFSLVQLVRKKITEKWEPYFGFALPYYNLRPNRKTTQFAQDFGEGTEEIFSPNLRAGIIFEGRDSEFIAERGIYFASGLRFSPTLINNTGTWTRWENDVRHYHPLIPNRWLWVSSQLRYATSTDSAPLPERVYLGSETTLRGLRSSRYVSNHSASLRAGLNSLFIRWELFGLPLKGGAGVFGDLGQIGESFNQLFTGETHQAVGLSLFGSYFTDDFMGHADFGFSKEGLQMYLGLGHSI